jgi:hypothetical protein
MSVSIALLMIFVFLVMAKCGRGKKRFPGKQII